MKMHLRLGAILLLFAGSAAMAADHRVEVLKEGPPKEVSKEMAALLSPTGFKVIRGTSRTVCQIWLCKEWEVPADFKPTPEVLYPFKPGQFVGVARYINKGSDFRDQDINEGVYTMRYAQQPVDGAHIGTSPTRDFLLLVEAEKDKSPASLDYMKLVEHSAEAAESTHPALLSMQRNVGEAEVPSMRHQEEHDWWILRFEGKAKAGDKAAKLPVELVVVGQAIE